MSIPWRRLKWRITLPSPQVPEQPLEQFQPSAWPAQEEGAQEQPEGSVSLTAAEQAMLQRQQSEQMAGRTHGGQQIPSGNIQDVNKVFAPAPVKQVNDNTMDYRNQPQPQIPPQ